MTDLYKFKNRAEYMKALDSILPDSYVQKRSVPSGTHKYYPAPIKEAVADDIFHYWNVIDEKYNLLINELVCTVKLSYMPSYPEAEELFCTGSAATPIQMDSGSMAYNFPKGKKTNALEYNLPSVRTEAISTALGGLGNIFGRNLNRKVNKNEYLPQNFTIRKHNGNINAEPEPEKEPNGYPYDHVKKHQKEPVKKIDIPF